MVRSGFTLENSVISRLRRHHSFVVESNDQWDHRFKIDFVVFALPSLVQCIPIGVQLTQRSGLIDKMRDFLDANAGPVRPVERLLYIEVEPHVDLDEGGCDVIATVIHQMRTDRRLASLLACGVHIFPDLTYELFDIHNRANGGAVVENPIPVLLANAVQGEMMGDSSGSSIDGVLTCFFPARGYGQAEAQDGRSFFVHANNVVDPALRDNLRNMQGDQHNISMRISFTDGGRRAATARYNYARDVIASR